MKWMTSLYQKSKKALLLDMVGSTSIHIKNVYGRLFRIKKSARIDHFEDLSGHGVTSAQLRICKQRFFKLSVFFLFYIVLR